MVFIRNAAALTLIVGLLGAPFSGAARASDAPNTAWLARVNAALAAMPPLSGRFEQKLPNGNHAGGSYHIDWPDRLRFAYDHGGASVVTVRGKFVAVQDRPGGEPNWFPVALTPLAVLREAVAHGIKPAMVTDIAPQDAAYAVTLKDPSGETPGQATLYFTNQDDQLYAWRLVDVQNLVTLVRLREITRHKALDKSVFAIVEDDESDDD